MAAQIRMRDTLCCFWDVVGHSGAQRLGYPFYMHRSQAIQPGVVRLDIP